MSSRYFVTLTVLVLVLMLFVPGKSYSQVIKATGTSSEASSQLVYYYDQAGSEENDSTIQVTNTNDTQAVTIHVQIFRSFDPDDDAASPGNTPPVFCDERNFIDVLTPNDTHVYDLAEDEFVKNVGEDETNSGEATSIDVSGTKGFVVITPVVSESDLTAISFEYMIGNTTDESYEFVANAMGRHAVDFTSGEVVADGTPLDGVTNGYEVLQPEELVFQFQHEDSDVDVVAFAFKDVYGPAGLLGYTVEPGSATLTSFIFDYKEDPTSCGIRTVSCFLTLGLNDDAGSYNDEFTQGIDDDLLCAGASTPSVPEEGGDGTTDVDDYGWTRMFVSGLGDFVNLVGFFGESNFSGASYMFTVGAE